MRREPFRTNVITQFLTQDFLNFMPRPPFIMLQQIGYVLKDEVSRLLLLEDGSDVEEEVALFCALEAELLTGLGEWLAGKARCQYVVIRDVLRVYQGDITLRTQSEVL